MLFVVVTFNAVSSGTIVELYTDRSTHTEVPNMRKFEFVVAISTYIGEIRGEFFSTDNSSVAIEL